MRRILAITLTAAAACGGGGGSGSNNNNPTPPTLSAACDQVVTAILARQQACTRANPDFYALIQPGQAGACSTLLAKEPAARLTIDTSKTSACVAAIQATSCADIADGPPGTCAGLAVGHVANGQSCYDSTECASGVCTSATSQSCPGQCVAAGALNGACPCRPGLYCDTSGVSPVCKVLKTSGACGGDDECVPGYLCRGNTTTSCVPAVALGETCAGPSDACALGYHCAGTRCEAIPKAGQACIALGPGAYAEGPMLGCYCTATSATCTAFKAAGAACTQFYECNVFAGDFCSAGKCTADTSAVCLPP